MARGRVAVDLTAWLLRRAAGRPHVLVATASGATAARVAVENELRLRGWPVAHSTADADLFVVCGTPQTRLAPLLDELWRAVAAPRARVMVRHPDDVPNALNAGARFLADADSQRATLAERDTGDEPAAMASMEEAHDMDEMPMPAGLPMAERGEDRDGLRLDELRVPLGPVLANWPSGLVVRVTLQGDVVTSVEAQGLAEVVPYGGAGGAFAFWAEPWLRARSGESITHGVAARRYCAAHLDSLGRLLDVAGWDDAATHARRTRDDALAGWPAAELARAVHRFTARVTRSRTLRWLTDGLGVLDHDDAVAAGISGPALRAGGDVTARWQCWLTEATKAAADVDATEPLRDVDGPRGQHSDGTPPSAALIKVLPHLLLGAELAGARLIVASLDPDVDELAATTAVPAGG